MLDNFFTWQAWFWRVIVGGAVRELGGAALQWAQAHPERTALGVAAAVVAVYLALKALQLLAWTLGRLWLLAALAVGAGAVLLLFEGGFGR